MAVISSTPSHGTLLSGFEAFGDQNRLARLAAEAALTLLQAESSVSYASGHLLFARDGTLMAQPFDPDARQPKGDAFPLAERVSTEPSRYVGASVSENGTLVYGRDDSLTATAVDMARSHGPRPRHAGRTARYINLALSPDERRVAVALGTGSPENRDIWIIDIARNVPSRLTFDPGADGSPVWSPDGTRIAFEGQRSGKVFLRQQLINGTAADEPLLEVSGNSRHDIRPSGWSADGRFIAYTLAGAFPRTSDVWVLPLFGDRKPFPLVQTEFLESGGVFSPDGRWIAYTTTKAASPTSTFNRFQGPAGNIRYQGTVGAILSGERTEGIVLRHSGRDTDGGADRRDGQFNAGVPQALFAAGAPHGIHQQPDVRRDEGWKAIPRQREATAVQRGAADRRPQLDGCDSEIARESSGCSWRP